MKKKENEAFEYACRRQNGIARDAFVKFNTALNCVDPKNLNEQYAEELSDDVLEYFDLLVAMWRGEPKYFNEEETKWLKPVAELYESLGDGELSLTDEQEDLRIGNLCGLYNYYIDNGWLTIFELSNCTLKDLQK